MRLGFKIPIGTIIVDSDYSEDDLMKMNSLKYVGKEIKAKIIDALFNKKRNFHLSIKDKDATKVDWKTRLREEMAEMNPFVVAFIQGMQRTAKVKWMELQEIKKLNGTQQQINEALEISINKGVHRASYARTILASLRDKDDTDYNKIKKEQDLNKDVLKELLDY